MNSILINFLLCFLCLTTHAQNVGIGTTTPTKAGLVVNSRVGYAHAIFGDNRQGVVIESNWPAICFNNYHNGGLLVRTLVDGYVGGMEMDVNGTINIYTNPNAAVAGNLLTAFTRLVIRADGNVGIGVPVPEALLHVNGNGRFDGYSKLGEQAPAIKMKKIVIPAGPAVNALGSYPFGDGITDSKVLGVDVLMKYDNAGTSKIPPGYKDASGYEYNIQVQFNGITIINKPGNSANIGGKQITVLVTYEE